ncbi:MAG: TIM-barrel domain-containing protein [Micromonosporaceae bacterium]
MKRSRLVACVVVSAAATALAPIHPVTAAAAGPVVDGKARFTVESPTLIRLEYAGDGAFEDRRTFNAVNRAMPEPAFTTSVEGGFRVIRTDKLTLRYRQDSGAFTASNLSVDLTAGTRPVTAHPTFSTGGVCGYGGGCEAEGLNLTGGASVASDHSGYTGSGFVAGLTGSGATIGWQGTGVPAAGQYAVQFRYANGRGGDGRHETRTISLRTGSTTTQVSLPITKDWDTWQSSATTVTLPAGATDLSLTCGSGDSCNVNVDSVAVTAVGATYPTPPPASTANLGGWRRALDGQGGPAAMADGLLSRDGWYLLDDSTTALLNSDGTVTERSGHGGQPYQDGYFFGYGHDYRQGLKDLRDLTGPSVLLPRAAFGIWYSRYFAYSDGDYRDSLIPAFREHRTPLDTLVVDTDWKSPNAWNGWQWNSSYFPDPAGFMSWAQSQGLRVSLNVHPGITTSDPKYPETADTAGNTLVDANCFTGPCKLFNFRDPAHLKAYFDLHTGLERDGVPIWWLDQSLGESATTETGVTPDSWINSRYAAHADALGRRGYVLARIGGNGKDYGGFTPPTTGAWGEHRYAVHFTGDTDPTWSMLAFQAKFTAREGSGIGMPYVSHDIGGFYANSSNSRNGHLDDDLYARWVQFGTFQPIFRLHSHHGDRLPWDYGTAAEASAEKFMRLRESLIPYTYSLARQSVDTGLPIVRGLYLNYPEYDEAYTTTTQYLYGDDVLVAPVTTPGTGTVSTNVWFPPGTWTDWFTGTTYTGPATRTVNTTLDRMPVFLRSGGIVPTRTDYVDHAGQSPLTQVSLDVAAGANGSFNLYEDAGEGNGYRSGQHATTPVTFTDASHTLTIKPRTGSYTGGPATRTWTVRVRSLDAAPSSATVNGTSAAVTYDAATRTATITAANRPATATTTVTYTPGAGPPTGPIVGVASDRCLDIPDGVPTDGTQLQLYDCNGTAAQTWTFPGDGTVRALGKCLDVRNNSSTNGTPVQIYTCNDTSAQKWTYDPTSRQLRANGKCLDAYGGGTASGTKLIIYSCHSGTNQQWRLPT